MINYTYVTGSNFSVGPIGIKLNLKNSPIVRVQELNGFYTLQEVQKILDLFKVERQF